MCPCFHADTGWYTVWLEHCCGRPHGRWVSPPLPFSSLLLYGVGDLALNYFCFCASYDELVIGAPFYFESAVRTELGAVYIFNNTGGNVRTGLLSRP